MYPRFVENLIEQLSKLPSIGRRSAERIVFWLLNQPSEQALQLSTSILQLKEKLGFCEICSNLTEEKECAICRNPNRDQATLCIVESPKDLLAIERTGAYKGLYHILLGNISPAEGRGPGDLKIHKLIDRVTNNNIKEIVIATDPDTEGEMTALHITNELKPYDVTVSRIGLGIPVGSSVEYVDASTLTMSMMSRREITTS